ncbi:hypothetical protein CN984_23540 [Bacillus cereus]|uniref:M23ase beta-sheet core domain-containing protein n=1 Tax=Bacillus cereus TaxID=1396 RepID=A0A2B9PL07_BACCE|nr:M23 family metallopeptidase [Bacillus cereus]PGO23356.1 hypothetical protein CN984_23540 [Bacillus cereus]
MPVGTPVYAAESGKIIYTASGYYDTCAGGTCHPNLITIKSDTDGYVTQYVHMNPLLSLSPGDHVKLGQQIGKIDLSGDTPTPHVHMARFAADGTPTCNWSIPITTTIPDNGLYKP